MKLIFPAEAETLPAHPCIAPTEADREPWLRRYHRVRGLSEGLCEPLEAEDYVIQSMPDASPAKWHLAHTSWFFETFVLKPRRSGVEQSDPHYAYLFNSYYNAVGPMHCRAQRGMISRPTVAETYRYRERTDEAMAGLIAEASAEEWRQIEALVELGLQHEQQHQELLLTDLKHMLAQNPLRPAYRRGDTAPDAVAGGAAPLRWLEHPGGLDETGHGGDGFCFDNETPRHRVYLPPFRLASRLVTNGEFIEFVADGGYRRPELWLSLGWVTAREQGWQAPLYWEGGDDGWRTFAFDGMRPVDPAAPVCHVSYFEADAFARWAGARLPDEAEWEVAARGAPSEGNFIESGRYAPAPAPAAGADDGLSQLYGDVWEWTRSAYSPYPGYRAAPGAIGEYNGKFMCNQYVLRGGSCATSRSHIRPTYRNFFPPDRRWQFSGLRLARDSA